MKRFLRSIFLNLTTLYIVSLFFPGLQIPHRLATFIWAAIVWTLLNFLIKPIVKLLLLPINLITLGLFGWAVNVITLFLFQMLISGVVIKSFVYEGFSWAGFIVPSISINLFFAYILTSATLSLVHSSLLWLLKPNNSN